ncbi:MAG: hypothetical protein AUH92_03035 [Acidobacteria bacterium 13_1_40CM_4_69_4]|nr:MAG: hypothetical protein AUH92_03035 [Acidobacteria bacterium 13_1_40CM_4_69_4]
MPEPLNRRTVPDWVWAAGVCSLALALRLVYVFQVKDSTLVTPEELDPGMYYDWAKQIAAGNWIGKAPFVQSPLYAYLLGILMMIIGWSVTRILIVQSFVGCGTVLLTYVLGRRLFGHWRGLLAAAFVALYGPFLFEEGMVMKTFLSPFLAVVLLLLFDVARQAEPGSRRGARLFAFAGVAYGLLTLDRDNFILLAPVLAGLALWLGGGLKRPGLRGAGAFTLGTVLMIAPVTLRNWVVAHEFVLLTTGGGEVFFIGNNADATGLYVPPPFVRPDPKYEHADFIARAEEISGTRMTPMQSSWFWFRQGLQFIAEEPGAWVRLLGRKLIHFWNFFELPDNLDYLILQRFSPLLDALNAAFPPPGWRTLVLPAAGSWAPVRLHLYSTFGTVAPLGLVGIVLTRRRWRRLVPLYVLLFGYMGTVLLFFNFARFRAPIVPILALFAPDSLYALGHFLRRLGSLLVAFAARSGDMAARARALVPGWKAAVAGVVAGVLVVGVNVEWPRGVVPGLEQALVAGNAYYAQGRFEEALQQYLEGLLLLGEGPSGPRGDAELRNRFGPEATREALKKELETESIARGPQFKGIHEVLLDKGERQKALPLLDEAIAQFNEVLRLAPAYLLSIRKMALAYEMKGDQAASIEWLRKGIDLWPDDPQARTELAEALYGAGQYKEALKQLDETRASNKTMDAHLLSRLYVRRGLILLRGLNEPGRALYNFERALELDPGYARADEVRSTVMTLRSQGFQPLADEPGNPAPASR